MWYWCSAFSGFWWIFPLMFIFCMAMMFLMMRAFFTGRFPCGMGHMGYGRRGSGKEGNTWTGTPKEG